MEVIGQLWTVTVAVACLGSGLACLAMALARIGGVGCQVAHGVMGLAMAGMVSPWGDPVPAAAGAAAFAVSGAWFASLALRRGPSRVEARHLAIASAAMVVMYLAGGHAGHGVADSGGLSALLGVALSLALAAYFGWHAWTCADRIRTPAKPGPAPTVVARTRTAARAAPVAHGVMSALMAAMFLGAT